MEIRHQQIDHLKSKARRDEDTGIARCLTTGGPRLERSYGGCSHGQYPAAARSGGGDCRLGGSGDVVPLAVHVVVGDVLGFHRRKGARAHMQGHAGAFDTTRLQCVQHRLVKVQGGCRCRHRARVFREHGLVAPLVVRGVRVLDIGRQGHMTVKRHQRMRFVRKAQVKQRSVLARPAPEQRCAKAPLHLQQRPDRRALAHLYVRDDLMVRQHTFDQQFKFAASGLLAKKAGLDHACVVKHQQVTGAQQPRQLMKDAIDRRSAAAIEQARGTALGDGVLGDQLGGQGEIKIANGESAHA